MPRIARGLGDNFIYHVLNRGNGKQKIFHNDHDYKTFVDLIKRAKLRHPVKIFAYCLMPNHFHIVLMPSKAENLSKFMQWLMTSHVRRYHKHYGTDGHIWQGRFKSFIVQEDTYLLTVLSISRQRPYGSSDWQLDISKKLGLESTLRQRGRPRNVFIEVNNNG